MWFTYPIKVNMALAAMNISPKTFADEWRSAMQQKGYALKLTPQETAIVIVSEGLGINYPLDVESAIGVWRYEKKLDTSKPVVVEALRGMGFGI